MIVYLLFTLFTDKTMIIKDLQKSLKKIEKKLPKNKIYYYFCHKKLTIQ